VERRSAPEASPARHPHHTGRARTRPRISTPSRTRLTPSRRPPAGSTTSGCGRDAGARILQAVNTASNGADLPAPTVRTWDVTRQRSRGSCAATQPLAAGSSTIACRRAMESRAYGAPPAARGRAGATVQPGSPFSRISRATRTPLRKRFRQPIGSVAHSSVVETWLSR
jgi:hypothetical protein